MSLKKSIIVVLIAGLSLIQVTKSHAQKADSSSRGFQAYGHIAGMFGLGSRYGLVLRVYKGINVDLSYGNQLLDYLGVSYTWDLHSYGVGLLYNFPSPINRTGILHWGLGINNFYTQDIDLTAQPAKVVRSHLFFSFTWCGKSGFTMHIRGGILVNTWDDYGKFNHRFGVFPVGIFEPGIGYTLKLKRKHSKHD